MPKAKREAQPPATGVNETLAAQLKGLPEQVASAISSQAEAMPELFSQAFPETESLTLRDRVLESLLDIILSGELKPGPMASENRVATLLSTKLDRRISRTPVREALAILVRDGFVRQFPQRGFQVVEVSADETREALSLCGEVEALALEQFTAASRPPKLTDLQAAQSKLAEVAKKNNRRSWLFWDTAFHAGLAVHAGLNDAARSIERWRQKVHLYSLAHDDQDETQEAAALEHDEIHQAIARGDDRAVGLLDQHLERTTVRLGLAAATPALTEELSAVPRARALEADRYRIPIEALELSVRAYNSLKRSGLHTVGEVLEMSDAALLNISNFGRRASNELQFKLTSLGFAQPQSEAANPDATVAGDASVDVLSGGWTRALRDVGEGPAKARQTTVVQVRKPAKARAKSTKARAKSTKARAKRA